MKNALLVLCGALIGGTLGFFGCRWLGTQGFYAMVLPGGLLGIGAGVVKNRSGLVAVVCGLLAVALGLFAEWEIFTKKDVTLASFLFHLPDRGTVTLLMIAAGGFIGFWIPFSRIDRAAASAKAP